MLKKLFSLFGQQKILTVLDIGNSKVCCLVARLRPFESQGVLYARNHKIEILGFGVSHYQLSHDLGSVTFSHDDQDKLQTAIRNAVSTAEEQAKLIVDSVIVSVSSPEVESYHQKVKLKLSSSKVRKIDLETLLERAKQKLLKTNIGFDKFRLLHTVPLGFKLDQNFHERAPLGFVGEELSAEFNIIVAPLFWCQTLESAINRAHLTVELFVSAAYASGLGVLTEEEAKLGTICLDLGAGTANMGIFVRNGLFHVSSFSWGGHLITKTLAKEFSLPFSEAEYLKLRDGTLLTKPISDSRFLPRKPEAMEQTPITYERFNKVILHSHEVFFYQLRLKLKTFSERLFNRKSLVLTGGGAQLPGITDFCEKSLGLPVRTGRPLGLTALAEEAKTPAFATIAGLLIYPQLTNFKQDNLEKNYFKDEDFSGNFFIRLARWLRENF